MGLSARRLQPWMAGPARSFRPVLAAQKDRGLGFGGLAGQGDRPLHDGFNAGKVGLRTGLPEVILERGQLVFQRPQGEGLATARRIWAGVKGLGM